MKGKKILIISIFIISLFLSSCAQKEENKGFKIYYNKKTVQDIDIIKEVAKKYEEKEKRKIEFIGLENEEKILNYVGEDKEASILLLDGYAFIEFVNKDVLRNVNYLYKEKNTRDKFSIITNIYGRYAGKYYGLGIMPFSLELVCNKEALKERGIIFDNNNINEGILKLKNKKIKIPSYIKSEYSKELLLSALIANDTIVYNIDESIITGVLKDKINTIKNGQTLFDELHKYYKEGSFREENFIDGGSELIEKFNKGEIPVVLTTTLASNKFDENIETIILDKLPIENKFVGAPVGVDIIVTSSVGNSNIEEVDRFFRYLIQDNGIEMLAEKNLITGNKKGDSSLINVQGQMAATIQAADEINKLYFNIISNEKIWDINKKIKDVMNGKYNGNEWSEILKKNKNNN